MAGDAQFEVQHDNAREDASFWEILNFIACIQSIAKDKSKGKHILGTPARTEQSS